MDLDLQGRKVLITGGSKGIGLACAHSFAREGASVIVAARDEQRLASACEKISKPGDKQVTMFAGDLGQVGDRERLFATHPDVDILVNNAGAIPAGDLFDIDLERWIGAWQLKVFGYVHLTRLYLDGMKKKGGGVIVNIIGIAGAAPRWEYICGSTGNAALIAFTRAAGAKSVDWNVRIFGINPAPTRTDRIESLLRRKAKDQLGDEERWRESVSALPFGRMSDAAEIADLAVVLASPRASYVSGTVIDVDGGQTYKG